jgi:glycosyltransferase involved in cell wall biosynthesis
MSERRVLIVTQYFWPEPSAPSVRYDAITRTLVALGVHVEVLTGMPNYPTGRIHPGYGAWLPRVETRNGLRIHRLPLFAYGGPDRWLRLVNHGSLAVTAFAGLVMDLDADIVLVESPPLPLVVPAAALAGRSRARLVMYCADLWPGVPLAMGALRPGFVADRLKDLESLCYRWSWRITVPTDGLFAALSSHPDAGLEKLLLLPNGVDTETFRPYDVAECATQRARLGPLADRALFLYAGTIGHAQALDTILDAAARLRADARIGFALLGDGPERAPLEARATSHGLDNVRFLGSVAPDEVARYLALSRATLAPLRDVALFSATRPAKVLPSLACAKPVIFAGRGEMATLLERERCGVVVPPEDAPALAAAVSRLTDDPDGARAMGERGRDFALREYDFSALVRRWWEALSAGLPPRARDS